MGRKRRPTKGFICVHCGHTGREYSRRLCLDCFRDVKIRNSYPEKKRGRPLGSPCTWDVLEDLIITANPESPEGVDYPPGSEDKIKVMEQRVKDGLQPFSTKDKGVDLS